MHSAPVPPDPESERRGHELRDVALKPILYFLIGLFVFGGSVQLILSAVMSGVIVPDSYNGTPASRMPTVEETRKIAKSTLNNRFKDSGDLSRAPNLQRNTTEDMLEMYREDDAFLNGYGIDKKTGKVHIPISRAMKKVVEKGLLKARPGVSRDSLDKDLPYPAHSLPYKATP